MKHVNTIFAIGALAFLGLLGCQRQMTTLIPHKLVATGNQHSVPMYPDELSYLHTSHEKQSGGLEGVVGDVKQKVEAKQLDDQTPIQIVSSDDYGAVVTITDGPMKGQSGFVPKQNID